MENPETKIEELRFKLREAKGRITPNMRECPDFKSIIDLADAVDGVLDLLQRAAFIVEVVDAVEEYESCPNQPLT